MPITSSTFAASAAQADGRVWINETHVDSVVGALLFAYLAANTNNAAAVMNGRVTAINVSLADAEFARQIVAYVPGLTVQQQTAAQFATRLREYYRSSSQIECARVATWILNHIDAGDVTDAQVRTAFGLTVNQYTTLKTKMTDLRTAYNAALAAQGE